MWWFPLWNIWTCAGSGWQSILQRVGHTGRGNFWKLCALHFSRGGLLLEMSCIENAGIQTPPHWLLFSELMASVSSDISARPGTTYTKSTNFCSLRRMKGSVFWAFQLTFWWIMYRVRFVLQAWSGVAYAPHNVINDSLRCFPFLMGLLFFYDKAFQDIPQLCHILWDESVWTFYKCIQFLLHLVDPTLCQSILIVVLILTFGSILDFLRTSFSPSACRTGDHSTVSTGSTISSFGDLLSSEILVGIY